MSVSLVTRPIPPTNPLAEMIRKFRFYERYGVEEYYVYDLDKGELSGWQRKGEKLEEIEQMMGWVSPRLGVRFEWEKGELSSGLSQLSPSLPGKGSRRG